MSGQLVKEALQRKPHHATTLLGLSFPLGETGWSRGEDSVRTCSATAPSEPPSLGLWPFGRRSRPPHPGLSRLQVLRLTTTSLSEPRPGSSRPLEADQAAFGKGTDQPPQGRIHRCHLPPAAAAGRRGWAGQRTAYGGPRTRGAPSPERDSLGFEPPLTGTLSCPPAVLLSCRGLGGLLWALEAYTMHRTRCIAPAQPLLSPLPLVLALGRPRL